MTAAAPLTHPQAPPRLYARFSRRFRAIVIDSVVYALSLVVMIVLLEAVHGTTGGGRVAFFLWLGFLFLYEPVLVWRRGATLGHMAANIRVVDLRTGGNPTFLRALGRFWLKGVVGLLAFAFMGTTRRHQALHDLAAGTVVEITDPAKASAGHFVEERGPLLTAGLPSWPRRVVVILAYSAMTWVLFAVALVSFESAECLERPSACTPGERLLDLVLGLCLLGSHAAWIILGWTGRLFGARRSHRVMAAEAV
jgi:uncharacterized RDD family membrane protein YckC